MGDATATFDGEDFKLGVRTFTLPGLSLKSLKEYLVNGTIKTLGEIDGIPTPEQVDASLVVIHAALARNYPGVTVAEVSELVDTRTVLAMVKAIFKASGLERTKPGEAPSP
jgi:hypothetical protein